MRKFIIRRNIELFERILRSDVSHAKRTQIEQLLTEARYELSRLEGIWSWTCPHLRIPNSVGAEAELLLNRIVTAQQANFASLQLWDDAEHRLCLIAHHNFDRASVEQFASVSDGDGSVCDAAQARRAAVVVEDVEKDEAFASLRGWTRSIGIRSIQTTPVFDRSGMLIGAFSTHFTRPRSFSSDDIQINSVDSNQFSRLFADVGRV